MSVLVRLPTPTPEDILNNNHKQLNSGKGYAVHQNNRSYIHDVLAGDRIYGQIAEHLKSRILNTPDSKILYFGLSITLFVSNIRVQTKVSIRTTSDFV